MNLLALTLVAAAALAQNQAPAAPSDEPVPTESLSSDVKSLKLGGFNFAVTLFSSSGVSFGAESYTNTLSLWLEPSFAIGKRFFKDGWLEPLAVSARVPFEFELTGNDPRFRRSGFASPGLLTNPEQIPITQAQAPGPGLSDGPARQGALLGDTWLSVTHGKLFTIPKAEIEVGAGLRVVLPTSTASRNATLLTAASIGLVLERTFGPLTATYSARPTKYFFTLEEAPIVSSGAPVLINGKLEQPWQRGTSGVGNPDWSVAHGASLDLTLPKGFSVNVSYFLLHVAPRRPGSCVVEGVAGANLCTSGPALGRVKPGAMRADHWFTLEAAWKTKVVTAALGLSTYRALQADDSSLSQPFFVANRNNFTTVYLSLSATAEELFQVFTPPEKKP